MKIAISTDSGFVSEHFGRCPALPLQIEDGKVVKIEEMGNPGHQPGFLPAFLAEKGVKYIIWGYGKQGRALFSEKELLHLLG